MTLLSPLAEMSHYNFVFHHWEHRVSKMKRALQKEKEKKNYMPTGFDSGLWLSEGIPYQKPSHHTWRLCPVNGPLSFRRTPG